MEREQEISVPNQEDTIERMKKRILPCDASEHYIGYYIKRIDIRLKASFDEHLRECDLTSAQAQVMEYVYWNGGKVTQKEIEIFMDVSHPTIVGIVSRMEKKGLLTCHMDTQDKRNKIVCATAQTEQFLEKMYEGRKANEDKLLRGFTDEEEKTVKCYMERLYQNIRE